ncbi:MAG TPA: ABC transporter permease [Acetobacteraceae bacterium]|nr:ABC transporter permease [Acetobacteraceae bacterium]
MSSTSLREAAVPYAAWPRRIGRVLLHTKLYWGLIALYGIAVFVSPVSSRGVNIFLTTANQSDVLRQVSNNGIVAVGMTLVILIGGIDLSVGSVMALGSVVCAMLLTQTGWSAAAYLAIPLFGAFVLLMVGWIVPILVGARPGAKPGCWALGLLAAAGATWWTIGQLPGKFGVLGVLLVVPVVGLAVGALNGVIVARARLQPFIVTLAMMVGMLGTARLVAGPDTTVYPVYTGTNATPAFESLRLLIWHVLPVPGLFFLAAVVLFSLLLRRTTFGRYVYAIGGNEQATRFSGIGVDRVKIAVYGIAGALAALAGVLYVAQYRQGKPDAGVGIELDAIAAVVIGGTNLMGGKGSIIGTLVGVLIFGFLGNILQLRNIDSNTQLVLKGVIIIVAVMLQEGNLRLLRRA